jgi:GH18 family chitinase
MVAMGHTDLRDIGAIVDTYLGAGAAPNKLVLGLATYGFGYILSDPTCNTPGCPARDPLPAADCLNLLGTRSYRDISKSNLIPVLDAASSSAYTVNFLEWIGFDSIQSIKLKLEYAKSRCMGGFLVWTIDMDVPGANSLIAQALL